MIITILPNSTTFHAIAYNEKKVEKGQAFLMEARNISLRPEAFTPEKLRQYFEDYSALNTRIKNTQFHVAVSCKGDEYSQEQLLEIAHRYLKEMGYAEEGQPLLVYAHQDTPNNHIHIVTSRVAPDGHRISDKFEKKRSLEITERIMKEYTGERQTPDIQAIASDAINYRYTSKAQYCAILECQGYECRDDESDASIHIYRGGEEIGTIDSQIILQHAVKDNRPDEDRRRQLRAILKKYRDLSASKEELAVVMKKKFGISLVFFGQKDSPYGYAIVDHKNKAVFKGGEFISIRELLQFENAATRFAKIEQTIDGNLKENSLATTRDINRLLHRQFETRIHRGTVSWNEETISLSQSVLSQLHRNNRIAMNPLPEPIKVTHIPQENQESPSFTRTPKRIMDTQGGSRDTNREFEVGHGMNASDIDDEQSQRAKWRR
jgi:hypothetical protein